VTVPLYLLAEVAAQEVGLVFNGEGGDQLFGGWANKPMLAAEVHGGRSYDRLGAYLETFHRFYGLEAEAYTPQARRALGSLDAADWVRPYLEADCFRTLLHRLRAANLWLKGAQNIAPRATQLAAAHGLRMQAPLFDAGLARWTFSLPPDWLLNGSREKYILKRVAERLLPAEIVWREKQGMGVPTTQWCLGPLESEVRRRLGKDRLRAAGWLNPGYVEALRQGEDQPAEYRRRRVGERLWALMMLQVWCDVQQPVATWPTAEREGQRTQGPGWVRRWAEAWRPDRVVWPEIGWPRRTEERIR
jgi:asparagine synthase (glutamine-hydrolysing)